MTSVVPRLQHLIHVSKPEISFVIRTYNEAAFIGRLLASLDAQVGIPWKWEVVMVDSGSTDDTVHVARQWPLELVRLRKEDFDYSKALNLGIGKSRGNLIVIISAHAIPTSNDWLARLAAHFVDKTVAGAYCRQVPWPDANWREVRRVTATFGTQSLVYDKTYNLEDITFSNAASCIRRSAWEAHPFNLPIAEDVEWAKWAINSGYKIIYEARASVYHSHNDTCRQNARRAIEFERGIDRSVGRARTKLLTIRQAAGRMYHDLRHVMKCRSLDSNRLRLVCDCLTNAYWFVHDFRN